MYSMDGRGNSGASGKCDASRVLIVDDEPQIRTIFQLAISMACPQLSVDLAPNGAEAVSLFQQKKHGVITMDLRMPVMDGWQAFNAIRDHCTANGIKPPPVIFVTGYALPKIVDEAVGDGSYNGLLMKPVMISDIVNEVKKRLAIAAS
jgi:CheY-like chemotaxis protein